MSLEIPECKRCLCCLPLRCGILTFAYLNLLFSLLVLYTEAWLGWGEDATSGTMTVYRGVQVYTHMWLPLVLYSLEIVFNMILIVGGHLKNTVLIRTYYYYGITTTIAAFVMLLMAQYLSDYPTFGSATHIIGLTVGATGFVVHIYLLMLIRTELKKPRHRSGAVFVNHMAEVIAPTPWGEGRNPL